MDWNDVIIFKEIAFVYIVNGKKFLDEENINFVIQINGKKKINY